MFFKISVAKTAGFCFGVHRALNTLFELLNTSDQPVRTLGPIIHNEQVLDVLRRRGVTEFSETDDVRDKNIVIRAHGITPQKRRFFLDQSAVLCNATCPKVAQVQGTVKKYANRGYHIAIVGDTGHAEVEGLMGYAGSQGMIVSGPKEAAQIPKGDRICIVAQTTQNKRVFDETVAVLSQRFETCDVFDTICSATHDRQQETVELANSSDLMIVVGSRNSANTNRLAEIASSSCLTKMIQSADDLDWEMLKYSKKIGITAGASTPNWVIRQVVERIRRIGLEHANVALKYLILIAEFFLYSNLYLALGAGFLAYGLSGLLNLNLNNILFYFNFWVVFLWSTLERTLSAPLTPDRQSIPESDHSGDSKTRNRRNIWLIVLFVLSGITITSGSNLGWLPMSILSGITASSIVFLVTAGLIFDRHHYSKLLKTYYWIKDIIFAVSCGLVIVGIPWIISREYHVLLPFILLFIMIMFWMRSVIYDSQNLQTDLMSGKTTLVLKIGEKRLRRAQNLFLIFWILVPVIAVVFTGPHPSFLLLCIVPIYWSICMFWFRKHHIIWTGIADLMIDTGIWIASLSVYLSSVF